MVALVRTAPRLIRRRRTTANRTLPHDDPPAAPRSRCQGRAPEQAGPVCVRPSGRRGSYPQDLCYFGTELASLFSSTELGGPRIGFGARRLAVRNRPVKGPFQVRKAEEVVISPPRALLDPVEDGAPCRSQQLADSRADLRVGGGSYPLGRAETAHLPLREPRRPAPDQRLPRGAPRQCR